MYEKEILIFRLDFFAIRRGMTMQSPILQEMTGNNLQLPLLIQPSSGDENFGGVWLWLQTSSFGRKRGFRIEWEVQDPSTTTGPPTPPPKPPKGK